MRPNSLNHDPEPVYLMIQTPFFWALRITEKKWEKNNFPQDKLSSSDSDSDFPSRFLYYIIFMLFSIKGTPKTINKIPHFVLFTFQL